MREVRIKLVSNDPVMDYAISKPEGAIVVMQSLIGDMANEYFAAVYLNTKNKPLDFMIVNIAGTDYSRMDPATVIKGALLQNATKVMLFHNHPSGELTPSQADLISTQKMVIAARDIKCLIVLAQVLASKYDVMITNPPYIGISSMEAPVKEYAIKNYPNSKTDMFAMFMDTGFTKQNGFLSISKY